MLNRPSSILIYILAISSTISAQGSQGYFNGSAFVVLENTLSPQERISFSFRTCSSGQLLHQEGRNGNFFTILLQPQGQLEIKWKTDELESKMYFGTDLANNRWHNVDFIYSLGVLTLYIDYNSVLLANSTYNSNLFRINLQGERPNLYIGRNFSGCILQGANVRLSSFNVQSSSVLWSNCPMPDEDCDSLCSWAFYNHCQNGGTCQEDSFGNNTECICQSKFMGQNCETLSNRQYCDSNPCQNGGSCIINLPQDGYICVCHEGYTGNNCDLNIDHCQTNPCKNNGTCTDESDTYSCDCNGTGYRGPNCEININECEEINPCLHESTCYDRYGDYICHCHPGYGNKNCEDDIDECISSPCENGGTCINFPARYECKCISGFTGINCEINIDNCIGIVCQENATCIDGINNFQCICISGFTGTYSHCSEINECGSNPCQNGGTCSDKINGFLCSCLQGFTGSQCELDASECNSNPCQNGGRCIDGTNSYTCVCAPGYVGHSCETNRNECLSNPCVNAVQCEDLVNDYHCDCLPGWERKNCDQNVDECVSQPCLHGNCIDLHNNYSCSCETGYSGYNCEVDIDDCHSQPCQNGGTCEDKVNDFNCTCTSRFMGKLCSEIFDACYSIPCLNGATCQSTPPSVNFHCICPEGFESRQCEINTDDCKNIDCPSGQVCFDLINGHECRCPEGFTGSDCSVNVDECLSNPCINGSCIDLPGNYSCHCFAGITGRHCEEDINECNSNPCRHGICQNSIGSYLCYCRPGYTGHQCHIEFDECLSSPCQNNGTCWNEISNYRCACIPGFTGRNCETDIDECHSQPCTNSGTCQDGINNYKCKCVPGFTGINCEVNIDECESSPCLNAGHCVDLINKYICNCSDTGFTGEICENNINDCQSKPCQHDSVCQDRIKDYYCSCYQGFSGKNCEIDFPDCSSNPCLNSAHCLEKSNKTLYDTNYRGLFPIFSFRTAYGYLCICPDGFTGTNCETNINDCETNECANGTCVDQINSYYCQCFPGFEGKHCNEDINECLKFMPCQNGGTCKDMIADYKCQCPAEYGGKNCSIELLGCRNNQCRNGATCIPYLNNIGQHQYNCHCQLGFYGEYCEIITTVSFGSLSENPTYWQLVPKASTSLLQNSNTPIIEMQYKLAFQFRTTLHNGFLVKGTSIESTYLLYLKDSAIHLSFYRSHVFLKTVTSQMGLNDAEWKDVVLIIKQNNITLNVSGEVKLENIIFNNISFILTSIGSEHSNITTNFTSIPDIPNFIGCIREVKLRNQLMIPQINSSILLGGKIGCDRKKQCNSDTCYNNGRCRDKWNAYACMCPRSFFGMKCQYSYSPATFGINDTVGWTEVEISRKDQINMNYFVDIGLIFRTRKDNGLVFDLTDHDSGHYSETSPSYLKAFIQNSHLHVVMQLNESSPVNITLHKKVDDGGYYFLTVLRNHTLLRVAVNDSEETLNVSSNKVLSPNMLYIGSYPHTFRHLMKRQAFGNNDLMGTPGTTGQIIESSQPDHGYFKGIIKDMKVNNKIVAFFPNEMPDAVDLHEILNAKSNENVEKGIISDDPCKVYSPCRHGAKCVDIWNEYWCSCPKDYRGKNCSELQPCAQDPDCPMNSTCHNLFNGYECVAAAAFNGSSKMQFLSNISTTITNITFLYRTLDHGVLLSINNNDIVFTIAVNNSIVLIWKNHSTVINKTVINFEQNMADGMQHLIKLIFLGESIAIWSDTIMLNLTGDNTLFNYMINNNTKVIVAHSSESSFIDFKGCIEEVRINGILLPFVSYRSINNVNFHLEENTSEVGCVLCWDKECDNDRYCENKEKSFNCSCGDRYKGRYCDIDRCIHEKPCKHNRSCTDNRNEIKCDCGPDYGGKFCDHMIDHCRDPPCQNSGTCYDMKPGFNCTCTENFEGKLCEISKVKDCSSSPCKNGGTCIDRDVDLNSILFRCICHRGYTGIRCENEIDFCQSSPCANGATCNSTSLQATFHCICPNGYTGMRCDAEIDECLSYPCKNGKCIPSFRNYSCSCNYGYMGTNCEKRIISCSQKSDLCNNGNCTDRNNSYACTCDKGYHGKHCILPDLCYHKNPCEDNEKCIRIGNEDQNDTTYKCICDDNGDGGRCRISTVAGNDGIDYVGIIGAIVGCIFFLSIFIAVVMFLRVAKRKRATRGTYSPSRQEMYGSRVEMNHVMKPPPEERLI